MKNITKIILVAVVGSLLFATSCFKAEDPVYNDATTGGAYTLQFTTVSSTVLMTPADDAPFEIPFGIKILGAPMASDITVNVKILDGTTTTSEQVKLMDGNKITIKAGEVQGNNPILVDPTKFALSPDVFSFEVQIEGENIAEFGGTSTSNFVYNVCPFDILEWLGGWSCDEVGYEVYDASFTLDADVPNRIHNTNFWDWPGAGATVYYDFSGDENQIVTIPDQPFTYGDGTEGSVSGSGTYDACTGKFECTYDVIYGGDNYPTEHFFFRAGKKSSSTGVWASKPDFLNSN